MQQILKTLPQHIQEKRAEIIQIAAKYGASNIRIFGSVARGEARDTSDIDFLIDIESRHSLLHRISLIQELEDLLNCKKVLSIKNIEQPLDSKKEQLDGLQVVVLLGEITKQFMFIVKKQKLVIAL